MHDSFNIEYHRHHLRVVLARDFQVTLEASKKLHQAAATAAKQTGLQRVLIEGDAPQCRMDTMEVLALGETTANLLRGINTAYCLRDYATGHLTTFFDNVVHNRGGRIGFFDDATPAKAWLGINEQQEQRSA